MASPRALTAIMQVLQASSRQETPPLFGVRDPMTPRCLVHGDAILAGGRVAWPSRAACWCRPSLPEASRAYLSPACRQYATMVSREGPVTSESPQPGPATGRSDLSTGSGGTCRPASHCFTPPSQPGANRSASRACPLASGFRKLRPCGHLGKRGSRAPVTFPGAVGRGGAFPKHAQGFIGQDPAPNLAGSASVLK